MFKFLCNTIGDDCSSVTYLTSAVASGYDGNDVISGQRNYRVRGVPQTLSGSGYSNTFSIRYNGSGCSAIDHMVCTDYDLNLPDPATNGFSLQYNDGSWHTIAQEQPISSTLLGVHGTDLLQAFSPVTIAGAYTFYLSNWVARPYTNRAAEFGKIYFSKGFDFGHNPNLTPRPAWKILTGDTSVFARPLRSSLDYEVEAQLSLTWENVTRAKAEEFKALPQLLNWPLFLYDSSGDLWNWKLEHVILDRYRETIVGDDLHNLEMTFYRLKHYR